MVKYESNQIVGTTRRCSALPRCSRSAASAADCMLPVERYDPGKGYDVITDESDASPATGDASPKLWGIRTTRKATHRPPKATDCRRSNATRTPPVSLEGDRAHCNPDRVTLVIGRLHDGKMQVTSNGWDTSGCFCAIRCLRSVVLMTDCMLQGRSAGMTNGTRRSRAMTLCAGQGLRRDHRRRRRIA